MEKHKKTMFLCFTEAKEGGLFLPKLVAGSRGGKCKYEFSIKHVSFCEGFHGNMIEKNIFTYIDC